MMASDLKRSPSFSLRKSFESTRFRRKHADSTATAPDDSEPPPPVPQIPRAATTQFDEPREPREAVPRLSKRKSVRDLFNQALKPAATRRGKGRPKIEHNVNDRSSRATNFPEPVEQDKFSPRDNSSEFSYDLASTVRNSAYSGSDAYKPLGAHPPPARMATVTEEAHVRSLREAELRKMFFGAPLFSVAGSRDYPRPQASYRDQDPDSTQDGRDFLDLQHSSFELATLQSVDGDGLLQQIRGANDTVEMPSILGLHGLEPGTIGHDHFLQLPLSTTNDVSKQSKTYLNRVAFQTDPESIGLRKPQVEHFIDRLSEMGDLYAQRKDDDEDMNGHVNEQKASEMYADLFSKLLTPPKYNPSSEHDPTGLDVQVAALIKTLNLPNIWYNLSDPDERLKLGQIIWSAQGEPEGVEVVNNRNVLLLQITLAAELLTRLELDSLKSDDGSGDEMPVRRRPKLNRKIVWDLVLAKRFLQDVCISPGVVEGNKGAGSGNRSSLFSMLSFVTAREDFIEDEQLQPILYPRHEKAQLNGLLSFAMALEWPHLDELKQKINNHVQESKESAKQAFTAPLGTPAFSPDDRDSYFGVLVRPNANRTLTSHSVQLLPATEATEAGGLNAAGWLSRSWLTGLVLPGDSASHLLISSLLENSSNALSALGDTANLTGGFVYRNRSYWSKSCVVGRVMAALSGSHDCMGWISIPSPFSSSPDGWINISSLPVPATQPRIKSPALISSLSTPYPAPKSNPLTETDFTWPIDGPPILGNDIRTHTLTFEASPTTFELSTPIPINTTDSSPPSSSSDSKTVSALPTSQAILTFTPPRSATSLTNLRIPLLYDVHFIASQPCFPKMRSPNSTPKSKTVAFTTDCDRDHEREREKDKALPAPPCHPLRTSYHYETFPALALLGRDERLARFAPKNESPDPSDSAVEGRERQDSGAGRSPRPNSYDLVGLGEGKGRANGSGEEKVLVLDCRGSDELQLLARAWCSKVGQHAVVGRGERTCLACCVREARGLGVGVVVRV